MADSHTFPSTLHSATPARFRHSDEDKRLLRAARARIGGQAGRPPTTVLRSDEDDPERSLFLDYLAWRRLNQ